MIRYLKRISKRSNLAACALAVCLFTFITISNFQNDVFNRKTFKKSSYHKKDIFPVAGKIKIFEEEAQIKIYFA